MHVLITGASAGLGAGMARRFAANGWDLTFVARREAEMKSLADQLGVRVFVRPADLSNPEIAETIVAEAEEELGPIDILVNNAGIQYVEPTCAVNVERIQRMMDINVVTPMAFIRGVLPGMIARNSGTIVNVASMAGLTHTPGMCHYNGAKAALAASSESLRVELRTTGVHVVTVYPGPVESDMEAAAREKYPPSLLVKMIPTGTPEGLARMVERAILSQKPRVIYPRFYAMSRYSRVLSQWATDMFTPPVLPGD